MMKNGNRTYLLSFTALFNAKKEYIFSVSCHKSLDVHTPYVFSTPVYNTYDGLIMRDFKEGKKLRVHSSILDPRKEAVIPMVDAEPPSIITASGIISYLAEVNEAIQMKLSDIDMESTDNINAEIINEVKNTAKMVASKVVPLIGKDLSLDSGIRIDKEGILITNVNKPMLIDSIFEGLGTDLENSEHLFVGKDTELLSAHLELPVYESSLSNNKPTNSFRIGEIVDEFKYKISEIIFSTSDPKDKIIKSYKVGVGIEESPEKSDSIYYLLSTESSNANIQHREYDSEIPNELINFKLTTLFELDNIRKENFNVAGVESDINREETVEKLLETKAHKNLINLGEVRNELILHHLENNDLQKDVNSPGGEFSFSALVSQGNWESDISLSTNTRSVSSPHVSIEGEIIKKGVSSDIERSSNVLSTNGHDIDDLHAYAVNDGVDEHSTISTADKVQESKKVQEFYPLVDSVFAGDTDYAVSNEAIKINNSSLFHTYDLAEPLSDIHNPYSSIKGNLGDKTSDFNLLFEESEKSIQYLDIFNRLEDEHGVLLFREEESFRHTLNIVDKTEEEVDLTNFVKHTPFLNAESFYTELSEKQLVGGSDQSSIAESSQRIETDNHKMVAAVPDDKQIPIFFEKLTGTVQNLDGITTSLNKLDKFELSLSLGKEGSNASALLPALFDSVIASNEDVKSSLRLLEIMYGEKTVEQVKAEYINIINNFLDNYISADNTHQALLDYVHFSDKVFSRNSEFISFTEVEATQQLAYADTKFIKEAQSIKNTSSDTHDIISTDVNPFSNAELGGQELAQSNSLLLSFNEGGSLSDLAKSLNMELDSIEQSQSFSGHYYLDNHLIEFSSLVKSFMGSVDDTLISTDLNNSFVEGDSLSIVKSETNSISLGTIDILPGSTNFKTSEMIIEMGTESEVFRINENTTELLEKSEKITSVYGEVNIDEQSSLLVGSDGISYDYVLHNLSKIQDGSSDHLHLSTHRWISDTVETKTDIASSHLNLDGALIEGEASDVHVNELGIVSSYIDSEKQFSAFGLSNEIQSGQINSSLLGEVINNERADTYSVKGSVVHSIENSEAKFVIDSHILQSEGANVEKDYYSVVDQVNTSSIEFSFDSTIEEVREAGMNRIYNLIIEDIDDSIVYKKYDSVMVELNKSVVERNFDSTLYENISSNLVKYEKLTLDGFEFALFNVDKEVILSKDVQSQYRSDEQGVITTLTEVNLDINYLSVIENTTHSLNDYITEGDNSLLSESNYNSLLDSEINLSEGTFKYNDFDHIEFFEYENATRKSKRKLKVISSDLAKRKQKHIRTRVLKTDKAVGIGYTPSPEKPRPPVRPEKEPQTVWLMTGKPYAWNNRNWAKTR